MINLRRRFLQSFSWRQLAFDM